MNIFKRKPKKTEIENNETKFTDLDENIEQDDVEIVNKNKKSNYGDQILPIASRPFFEIYAIHIDQAKKWKNIAFASLAITAFSVVWAAKVSTGIKYVPVLISQSDVGTLTPLGALNSNQMKISETIIVAQVGQYIQDLRSVIQDVKLEQQRGNQIALLTADSDKEKMQQLFIQQLKDSGKDTITINISQIMPLRVAKEGSWKVTWTEYYGTTPQDVKKYEAIFNVSLKELGTNNPDEIMLNPTGLQISNFTMSEIFNQNNNQ